MSNEIAGHRLKALSIGETATVLRELEASRSESAARLEVIRRLTAVEALRRDHYESKCSRCNGKLGDFMIYVEDCDGKMRDGNASILANFVFCGPKCLAYHAADYGKP